MAGDWGLDNTIWQKWNYGGQTWVTADTSTADSIYYTTAVDPVKKKPETALQWLDRRVDEIRVAL